MPPTTSRCIPRRRPIRCCTISVSGPAAAGRPNEPIDIRDYLPSAALPASCPDGVVVDVIIAAYRGLQETQHCLNSVLEDPDRPPGQVIVVEDCSPEPHLAGLAAAPWHAAGASRCCTTRAISGFVASVNRGMAGGRHARCRAAEQRHGGAARLAAPARGTGLCDAARGFGVALLQQRNDLRLSQRLRRVAGVRTRRASRSTRRAAR